MRETKFKYFAEKQDGTYIKSRDFTMDEIEDIDFNTKLVIGSLKSDSFGKEFVKISRVQYTGLKDKNGVEIYEGDVVNIFGSNTEIEFYEGCFGYWIWKEKKYRNFITATISDKEEIEVIGNIYELAHLLDNSSLF